MLVDTKKTCGLGLSVPFIQGIRYLLPIFAEVVELDSRTISVLEFMALPVCFVPALGTAMEVMAAIVSGQLHT